MNKIYKAALLAALGLISATAAQAAGDNNNTMYLGFTTGTASSDIVLNLGLSSGLVGQTSVVDLSSDLTTAEISAFNTTFPSGAAGVNMSVIGGNSTFNHGDIFATQTRVGGAGTASTPGSSVTEVVTSANMTTASGKLNPGTEPWPSTAGSFASLPLKSFNATIQPGASTFYGTGGVNPAVAIPSSDIVYADLWEVVGGSSAQTAADVYEGYFAFNANTDSLTFTGSNVVTSVPEPTTYGLLAGAGLLVVSLRNQFRRKQA